MKQYLDDLARIMRDGDERSDRTSTGTRSIFGLQSRYDLREGFPAVTTKKLAWRAVVSELLWFIEGSGDERRLAEILHGTRDLEKKTIWTANAAAPYWKGRAQYSGDLGRVYGVQWRKWRYMSPREPFLKPKALDLNYQELDQLQMLIDGLRADPHSRRHIISAWNPAELDQMALPPCHILAQFYVNSRRELSCQLYQRSADFLLGVPFNIASYALFTHMLAQVCGLKVGDFVHTIGDAHLYLNHLDAAQEQLARDPLPLPTLWLNPAVTDITKFTMADIRLDDYESHAPIQAPMAV